MSVKKWVMSDEWWVMSDEWWVMEIEWRKLSDEKYLTKQALNDLTNFQTKQATLYKAWQYSSVKEIKGKESKPY